MAYRNAESDLLANLDRVDRGCWDYFNDDARAKSDYVHLTRFGYAQLATSLGTDVLHAYDEWRAELGLPPTNAEHTWGIATR